MNGVKPNPVLPLPPDAPGRGRAHEAPQPKYSREKEKKARDAPLSKTIKIEATPKMQEDLEHLKKLLDASSNVEAVRRAVALVVVLYKKLQDARCITIEGLNPDGKEIEIPLS